LWREPEQVHGLFGGQHVWHAITPLLFLVS
jgi:hypothetical protein